MRRWNDQLSKHPINTTVRQLLDALDASTATLEPRFESEHARFSKVVFLLRDTLREIDPDITPIDILDTIDSQIQRNGILSAIQEISTSSSAASYRELNAKLSESLSYIIQLQGCRALNLSNTADLEAATSGLERFSTEIDRRRKILEAKISDMSRSTDQEIGKVGKLRERAEELIRRQEAQFLEMTASAKIMSNEFKSETENLLQSFINKSEIELASEIVDLNNKLKVYINESEESIRDVENDLQERVEVIIDDALDKHKRIIDLYNLVATDSITGGHKGIADREFTLATNWRRTTVAAVFVTLIWLVFSLMRTETSIEPIRLFWLHVGKTISITLLFVSFVVYASKQASLHRLNERKMRAFFLQVQAFDPFVSSLPEEKRFALKETLSVRIFGSEEGKNEKEAKFVDESSFRGIEQILEHIEKIAAIFKK